MAKLRKCGKKAPVLVAMSLFVGRIYKSIWLRVKTDFKHLFLPPTELSRFLAFPWGTVRFWPILIIHCLGWIAAHPTFWWLSRVDGLGPWSFFFAAARRSYQRLRRRNPVAFAVSLWSEQHGAQSNSIGASLRFTVLWAFLNAFLFWAWLSLTKCL